MHTHMDVATCLLLYCSQELQQTVFVPAPGSIKRVFPRIQVLLDTAAAAVLACWRRYDTHDTEKNGSRSRGRPSRRCWCAHTRDHIVFQHMAEGSGYHDAEYHPPSLSTAPPLPYPRQRICFRKCQNKKPCPSPSLSLLYLSGRSRCRARDVSQECRSSLAGTLSKAVVL